MNVPILQQLAVLVAVVTIDPATVWVGLRSRANGVRPWRDERGQATTEYALVLLAAALVAVLVITWATAGGGAEKVGQLFNKAIDSVIDKL